MYWDSNQQYRQPENGSNDAPRETYGDFAIPNNQSEGVGTREVAQTTPIERIRLDEAAQHELAERRSMVDGVRVMTRYIAGPTGMRADLLNDHAYSKAQTRMLSETAGHMYHGHI